MPFIARISGPDWKIPVRAYLHSSGIEAFGSNSKTDQALSAADYMGWRVLGDCAHPPSGKLFEPAKYLLVALYGSKGEKVAEVFGYGDYEGWPGNPTKYRWTFRNSFYTPCDEDGCEDTDIVLCEEGKYRRRTPDLKTFMESPPNVGNVLVGEDYHAVFSERGAIEKLWHVEPTGLSIEVPLG